MSEYFGLAEAAQAAETRRPQKRWLDWIDWCAAFIILFGCIWRLVCAINSPKPVNIVAILWWLFLGSMAVKRLPTASDPSLVE